MPRKEQPWKSLVPDAIGASQRAIPCVGIGCTRTFKSLAGLGSHMRTAHLDQFRKYGVEQVPVRGRKEIVAGLPAPVNNVQPEPEELAEQAVEDPVVPVPSPLQLLDSAIKSLRERLGIIDSEVLRLSKLQAEREAMESQINALETARMAFDLNTGVAATVAASAR